VHGIDDGDEEVYLRINRFNYPRFAQGLELIRTNHDIILIMGTKKRGFGNSVQVNEMLVIDPDEDERHGDDDEEAVREA
jgi:Zierdtviridae DNA polymerase